MSGLRTYAHLQSRKRIPSPYEVATTDLHYYAKKGFEIDVPVKSWYQRYQTMSPFARIDFAPFQDPRATTYTRYVELQKEKEIFVDRVFSDMEKTDYDKSLPTDWIETLDATLPQLRFVYHGLQMVAAYVGQMAPDSKITIAATFQSADEMRRIQKIAYRMRLLQETVPTFGERSREKWQNDPLWQPLRRLIEELLVTYDWGEAFIALTVGVKAVLDPLINKCFASEANRRGDYQLTNILRSLDEDCSWHRDWHQRVLLLAAQVSPEVKEQVREWACKWHGKAISAGKPIAERVNVATSYGQLPTVETYLRKAGL